MFRRFSANFAVLSIFLDAVLAALALFAAARLRGPLEGLLAFLKPIPGGQIIPLPIYFLFPLVWVSVLMLFSVYDGRKNLRVVDEMASLTLGAFLAGVAMAGVLYFSYRDLSRFLYLFACALAYLSMAGWRGLARLVFRRQGLHVQSRRTLILGAGVVGRRIAEQIRAQPWLGLELAGFLDDDWQKQAGQADIFGSLQVARQVVRDRRIDDVIVALPLSAYQRLTAIVTELHDLPVRVWVIPDYFSLTLHRSQVEEFAGIPMLDLRAPTLSEYQRMLKRGFDLVVCILTLPLLLPVLGIIALAVKLDSRGPVLYNAARVGENGRLFAMHKFRTMVQNADRMLNLVARVDENGQTVYKTRDDPRITRVGRLLRRTSLDELPQLFNVLKGEMSLVGPRPELPDLVERYAPWQRTRFTVPQGMTGWWQINGRSDKPMHLHTEEDLYYVQHYSIWLDLQILFKTVWVVLRGKGAY